MQKLRLLCTILLLVLTFTGCTVNENTTDTTVSTDESTGLLPEITADKTKDQVTPDKPPKDEMTRMNALEKNKRFANY